MELCIISLYFPLNALQICHCWTWIKQTHRSLSGRMKGRVGTERGNKDRKGFLHFFLFLHLLCVLSLYPLFFYICQSICSICLSSVYKEERQQLKGSVNHYPLLTPWHQKANRLPAGNICLCVWERMMKLVLGKHSFLHTVYCHVCISTVCVNAKLFIFLCTCASLVRVFVCTFVCTWTYIFMSYVHLCVFALILKRVFLRVCFSFPPCRD